KLEGANWVPVGIAASSGEATDISIAISDKGIPFIAYRDAASMRRTTVMKFSDVTNTNSIADGHDFKVYPNPGNGVFTIESSGLQSGEKDIEIFDQLGQLILSQKSGFANKTEIDLSGKANGVYILKLKSNNGAYSKSIVIKR
ncbi:MAG: T9SS type A sorting domain-containing protein, partial [Bacteroidota bacterium]|nr:T9SS type A sorting domain-containing protein [Bacteroidota bacterium]